MPLGRGGMDCSPRPPCSCQPRGGRGPYWAELVETSSLLETPTMRWQRRCFHCDDERDRIRFLFNNLIQRQTKQTNLSCIIMLIPPINDHKFDQRSYGEAVGAAPDTHLPRRLRPHVNKKASTSFRWSSIVLLIDGIRYGSSLLDRYSRCMVR